MQPTHITTIEAQDHLRRQHPSNNERRDAAAPAWAQRFHAVHPSAYNPAQRGRTRRTTARHLKTAFGSAGTPWGTRRTRPAEEDLAMTLEP